MQYVYTYTPNFQKQVAKQRNIFWNLNYISYLLNLNYITKFGIEFVIKTDLYSQLQFVLRQEPFFTTRLKTK